MKRAFRFRLARVARVRELFEETARMELSAALGEVRALEDRMQAWNERLHAGRADLALAQTTGALDVQAHLARHQALGQLEASLLAADTERLELVAKAEEARATWRERRAEKEALAKLAERHRDRHRADLARAEAADLDEIASQRAHKMTADYPSSRPPLRTDRPESGASPAHP